MSADHTSAFKAELEAAVEAEDLRLARFHYLLGVTRTGLVATPDDQMLWAQLQALEDIITIYEATDALLCDLLEIMNNRADRHEDHL